MAHQFKTVSKVAPSDFALPVYSAPSDKASIVMLAQVANVGSVVVSVSYYHSRINVMGAREYNALLSESPIPPGDARSMLSGRLVLEPGDRIYMECDPPGIAKITMSVMETDI